MKNMITLKISNTNARKLHKTAAPEIKSILEDSCPDGFFSQDITERIKTYEDACIEMGVEFVERHVFDELEIIIAALNEGWEPDLGDCNQQKWIPWFDTSSGGFVFRFAYWTYTDAATGDASRLCLKSKALAEYVGKQFIDQYKKLIMTPPMKRKL